MKEALRLHIGGREPRPGWKILNIMPGPDVDFVGNCTSLDQFEDDSVEEIYASHVLEHLGFRFDLPNALAEFHRVLAPGGVARISVPDMDVLCKMMVHPQLTAEQRILVVDHIFGAQNDEHDYHRIGLNFQILTFYLARAGFSRATRVTEFNMFNDFSTVKRFGCLISLNVEAYK